jgi:D-alanyl-D-alanine carboxypeptidase (penicillin-binding protein 5/6)
MAGEGPTDRSRERTHRRSGLTSASEARLREIGEQIPKTSDELDLIEHNRRARVRRRVAGAVVAVVVVLAGVAWFSPPPPPTFRPSIPTSLHLPGSLPSFTWPAATSAALSVDGGGSLGTAGGARPSPIAGLAQVMTAYVILKDHPLALGANGPGIPVTSATLSATEAEAALQQPVVPVASGESLTELQALEGMLVAQGNNLATLLASWDAGSESAFVVKMNAAARSLGLSTTTFTDPSGIDPGTVSTPQDLIRLGETAMSIPAFAEIVSMPQVTLPVAGLVYNLDSDLGSGGIEGIKFGSDLSAGGCFLFWSQQTVDGKSLALVGAVLAQRGPSPQTASMYDALALSVEAFASARTFQSVLPTGREVGRVTAPWGLSVPVEASSSTVVGWPGQLVGLHLRLKVLRSMLPSDSDVGVLEADLGGHPVDAVLRTSRPIVGPSVLWRLTRL